MMLTMFMGGCISVPHRPARLERSSYGCMTAVLREKLPANLPDKRAHCLASGLIARYCSPPEAYLAGIGKEAKDLVGAGDFERADWRADRKGVECARHADGDEALTACCSN
jgi:hypothetical protein